MTGMATVHIIGAGISGLAAATALAAQHIPVKLYESSPHAGGRCRSVQAEKKRLDNGIYLTHPGDTHFTALRQRIHATDAWIPIAPPALPRASLADYWSVFRLLLADDTARANQYLRPENPLYHDWLRPWARGLLRTPHDSVSARAMAALMLRSRRWLAPSNSLQESLVNPALHFLEYCGGSVYFGHALHSLGLEANTVRELGFARKKLPLAPADVVILATPGDVTAKFFSELQPPASHAAITLHFRIDHRQPPGSIAFSSHPLYDLIRFEEGYLTIGITVADAVWHRDPDYLVQLLCAHLRTLTPRIGGLDQPLRKEQVIIHREKRAGHGATPQSGLHGALALQPHPRCVLAGDWLQSPAPATLESAATSGHRAAELAAALLPTRNARHQ